MELRGMTNRPEYDEVACFGYRRLTITCDDELANEILRLCFKRGKWIFEKGDGETCVDSYICSDCGKSYRTNAPYFGEFIFCPNCGIKMEGDLNGVLNRRI